MPGQASRPFIAASGILQMAHYLLSIATCRMGEVSHAYPPMRAGAPLMVALGSGLVTGQLLTGLQWRAMLLMCGGVPALQVRAASRTGARPATRRSPPA